MISVGGSEEKLPPPPPPMLRKAERVGAEAARNSMTGKMAGRRG